VGFLNLVGRRKGRSGKSTSRALCPVGKHLAGKKKKTMIKKEGGGGGILKKYLRHIAQETRGRGKREGAGAVYTFSPPQARKEKKKATGGERAVQFKGGGEWVTLPRSFVATIVFTGGKKKKKEKTMVLVERKGRKEKEDGRAVLADCSGGEKRGLGREKVRLTPLHPQPEKKGSDPGMVVVNSVVEEGKCGKKGGKKILPCRFGKT